MPKESSLLFSCLSNGETYNKFSITNFQFSINFQLFNFQLFCHSERSEESLANARFANKWRDSSASECKKFFFDS